MRSILIPGVVMSLLLLPAAPQLGAAVGVELGRDLDLRDPGAELAARERALASRPLDVVEAEVRARAEEMGVPAPVAELTRLLLDRAWLEIAIDRCELGLDPGGDCATRQDLLVELESRFRELAGLSAEEFKSGRWDFLDDGRWAASALTLPGEGGSTRTDPEHCICDVSVANLNRWMNRYWGLECACHSGHGVCSDNLDVCWLFKHSPGKGAMTGAISLYFGDEIRVRGCPDDHKTCFKGPMPSKPGGGEWTNVCNCDTWHSQFSNPLMGFYGGDLTDNILVAQAAFWDVVADGPCANRGMMIKEFIEENDPGCCDDPMGDLIGSLRVRDGTTSVDLPVSAQNCNGGSQSGVPPYCGSFGATLRVQATCQTRIDEPDGSCYGRCGELLPEATCNCDFDCQYEGDCCWDYCEACSAVGDEMPFPCDVGSQ